MPTRRVLPKSSKSWKDAQIKVKKNRNNRLAIGVLGLIIGFLVISWSIHLTQSLFGSKKNSWDGGYNFNLLIRSPALALLSYNPQDNRVMIVEVPDETFLEVPHGFGTWQARSIYDLGQSQKGIGGDQLLKEALTAFFAIPIDGFIDFSRLKTPKSAAEIVEILRKNPISGFNFLSALKTDLTMWEILKLKWGISSVRFDKIQQLNLIKLNVLEREKLADGTPIFIYDPVRLDSVLLDFQDSVITSERKTIAVFNATDHPQLAQKWTRLITNLGGNVIITGNAEVRLMKTQVLGENSSTLKRLQQIFVLDCQNNPKCVKINPKGEDISFSRAQINVLLGEDYADK